MESAAPQEMQENGLSLVLPVVTGDHKARPDTASFVSQGAVPLSPGGLFDASPGMCLARRHWQAADNDVDADLLTERNCRFRVCTRRVSQTMIDMNKQ
jgi:hypothetical protein